ncbi:MAG: pseudouridine synthase [Candidatus Kerfeldbacteria bacterium]
MRLNKYIASCGITSRRKADDLIVTGKVVINNEVVCELGTQIDPKKDKVVVDGQLCSLSSNYVYIALNKPVGYVCTHARFHEEQSIFELLPNEYRHLKFAGRLDKDSEGLLILSDDGDFIYKLTHPSYRHEKEYEVKLDNPLSEDSLTKLERGIRLTEGIAKMDRVSISSKTVYNLVIHQGWKRQIRRMLGEVRSGIQYLKRVRVGKYKMGKLPVGKYKDIDKEEVV